MDLDDSVINSLKDDDYDTSCVHHSSMKQEFPKGKMQPWNMGRVVQSQVKITQG